MADREPTHLALSKGPEESAAQGLAHAMTTPAVRAALSISDYSTGWGSVDVNTLTADLAKHCNALATGDLQQAEVMLLSQAHTLDAIFNSLAARAARNFGEAIEAGDRYLRLALRAQGQCRATLETLALIKNPRALTFVRQQNVAGGHQQVNNRSRARAGKSEKGRTKILEAKHVERLDTGAAPAAERLDSDLVPLGKGHRSANAAGQGSSGTQRLSRRRGASAPAGAAPTAATGSDSDQ